MITLVCGAAGQIGVHLVARLRRDGHFVRALDRREPPYGWIVPPDEFWTHDLRYATPDMFAGFQEVYQLAAEVGGLGFIMDRDNDAMMLRNSVLINLAVLDRCASLAAKPRVFFASSACVYPSLPTFLRNDARDRYVVADAACRESDAYPAHPDNEYAWEKLFSERLYDAYARNHGLEVRVARLHNTYGPFGAWRGGREKAPAAICRKVAEVPDSGMIEIWGDGRATRSFTWVEDTCEGIVRLMRSDFRGPVNIGSSEMVTVNELVRVVSGIAGKTLVPVHVDGPVGVAGRNSDNALIREKLGWEPTTSLDSGLRVLYPWVAEQVELTALLA